MRTIETFAVIGGDLRSAYLAGSLAGDGYRVITSGFDSTDLPPCVTGCTNPLQAMSLAECVILPLPVTTDGVDINAPFSRVRISVDTVLQGLTDKQFLVGGQVSEALRREMSSRGLTVADYLEREEFAVMNAVPTAEGAVQLAMEELPVTLDGSRCLVTGYGRVARALSHVLNALGAQVTVAARSCSDRAWAKAEGCQTIDLSVLPDRQPYEVIFNTVPARLFTRPILEQLEKNTLLIDLSSRPGGVDFPAAAELRLKTIWALSLPGRVAPQTAGRIIKESILNMIREDETWSI